MILHINLHIYGDDDDEYDDADETWNAQSRATTLHIWVKLLTLQA
jgi:hypothetical protein